jgi:hypothetical protein
LEAHGGLRRLRERLEVKEKQDAQAAKNKLDRGKARLTGRENWEQREQRRATARAGTAAGRAETGRLAARTMRLGTEASTADGRRARPTAGPSVRGRPTTTSEPWPESVRQPAPAAAREPASGVDLEAKWGARQHEAGVSAGSAAKARGQAVRLGGGVSSRAHGNLTPAEAVAATHHRLEKEVPTELRSLSQASLDEGLFSLCLPILVYT